ncbi:MAG: ABC transporter permease, partial [Solobacterium sp.]|nr:ABC transporter permease [Solobacterium sp.]
DDKYLVSDERDYQDIKLMEASGSGGRYPRLISVNNTDYTDLHYFDSKIKKGRTFNDEDIYSVIVPENLYLSDGENKYYINAGDYLTVEFFNVGIDGKETIAEYYLEVVGIVSNSKQIARDSYNIHKTLIIPEALFKIITDDIYPLVKDSLYRFGYYDSITFYPVYMTLNNLEDIFRLNEMIDGFNTYNKDYSFSTDVMDFALAYGEIKSIVANLNSLFYVSLIVNIMIMFFIFKQDIENRKQETGILMALGLNGRMISVQFYLEYLFICLLSFVVSLPLSNVLINRMSTVFGIEFKLMAIDYLLLGAIIVGVFTVSTLISFIRINKFSVKEILNNE